MNEIVGKLTNLSYEIFGVFLPGIVGNVFLLLLWQATGPVLPFWTNGVVAEFSLETLRGIVDSFSAASGMVAAIALLTLWYFIGHVVLWLSRSGKSVEQATKKPWKRLWLSLIFRVPKPTHPYNEKLENLYGAVRQELSYGGTELEWRQFYPVAKCLLAEKLVRSLVATYQNKYTFHRSVVAASAMLFWLTLIFSAAAWLFLGLGDPKPIWLMLGLLLVGSIVVIWNFSSSYMHHWEMFGNSVITETYSLLWVKRNADFGSR